MVKPKIRLLSICARVLISLSLCLMVSKAVLVATFQIEGSRSANWDIALTLTIIGERDGIPFPFRGNIIQHLRAMDKAYMSHSFPS
jgi:hypothetical protein